MQMRTILLDSFQELDNGVTHAVPVDFFKKKLLERIHNAEDFELELKAALHEGDFSMTSPGMIEMTQAGRRRRAGDLQIS